MLHNHQEVADRPLNDSSADSLPVAEVPKHGQGQRKSETLIVHSHLVCEPEVVQNLPQV